MVTVARALTAAIGWRVVRLATILSFVAFILVFVLCWVLAYFLSAWWWLLVIPFASWLIVFLIVRQIIAFLLRQIYPETPTKQQRKALDSFVNKIWGLLEAKSTPMPIIVLICVKDLLFHRDIMTIKSFISDSKSLTRDYRELEKLF